MTASDSIGGENVYEELLGGVFEYHSAPGCIELPYNGHVAFRDIEVEQQPYLRHPTPDFGNSTPD